MPLRKRRQFVDITFFGGLLVLIAALYIIFWIFDRLHKGKPEQEPRGTIDTLCSCKCTLISGGGMVALGIISLAASPDQLGLRAAALLIAGVFLLVMGSVERKRGKKPPVPEG